MWQKIWRVKRGRLGNHVVQNKGSRMGTEKVTALEKCNQFCHWVRCSMEYIAFWVRSALWVVSPPSFLPTQADWLEWSKGWLSNGEGFHALSVLLNNMKTLVFNCPKSERQQHQSLYEENLLLPSQIQYTTILKFFFSYLKQVNLRSQKWCSTRTNCLLMPMERLNLECKRIPMRTSDDVRVIRRWIVVN